MTDFTYPAIKVVQRPDAAPFYLLQASAEEVLAWADVPRKKAGYMAGYQRELDERHTKIRDFLELDKLNVVPGAVIIAVANDAVTVTETDVPGVVSLKIAHAEAGIDELLQRTYAGFLSRLNASEKASVEGGALNVTTTAEDVGEDADEEDSSPPPSYLAVLAQELKAATQGFDSLPEERRVAIAEYLQGTAKPGLILDGQHRVFGAKEVQKFTVFLPVVLMPGLPPGEQVFHFYVLNNKAKPLTPTELRATVSTSLSNQEIDGLYTRLLKSGVKAEEAGWTHKINTDPNSPFRRMVDFGFSDKSGCFLPENVMFQVVSKFMKPPRRYRLLFADLADWQNSTEYRLRMFFAFWSAIQAKYQNAWAEGKSSQLLMKVSMLVLQEMLFDKMSQDMPKRSKKGDGTPFKDSKELAGEIEGNLHFLTEEFFTKKWMESGLDTSEGHKFLREQMDEAINRQGEKLGHLALFKVKSKPT